ncbi:hypothetical protein ACWF9G_09535 [Nocardia sp. NPDC055029]
MRIPSACVESPVSIIIVALRGQPGHVIAAAVTVTERAVEKHIGSGDILGLIVER